MEDTPSVSDTRAFARSRSPSGARPLYVPLDWALLRAPLFPVEYYLNLQTSKNHQETSDSSAPASHENPALAATDPFIRQALALGSGDLVAALERTAVESPGAARLQGKLLRYLIRMSTRPTPYGLFAGVALVRWGQQTDLALAGSYHTRMRPDMDWLLRLVMTLEAQPAIRNQFQFVTNPMILLRAGRVFLAERVPNGTREHPPSVSVRATRVVRHALALACEPIPYHNLVGALLEATPGATREQVEALLANLWEQTLLLTDLRPPLTTENPAQYVLQRLRTIPEASETVAQLEAILAAVASWDREPMEGRESAYHQVLSLAGQKQSPRSQPPVQVDTRLNLAGHHITHLVALEAALAAELLLKLTPHPQGLPHLSAYRQAFEERYGADREVPLLELLHPTFGLGPADRKGAKTLLAIEGSSSTQITRRTQMLLHLATSALHDHQSVLELDPETLAALTTWPPATAAVPVSLDLCCFIAAPSTTALDAGQFQLIIGPNVGAPAAGRNLGRFADLFPTEGSNLLARVAHREETLAPTQVWAELVYLPQEWYRANVTIRPAVRRYEIVIGVSPGVAAPQVIPLRELVVGIRNHRFYIRWPQANAEVHCRAGHMLNGTVHAPAVFRFLADVEFDGQPFFHGFDWGPAEVFPFLPRVQVGRSVLRLAHWRIDALTRKRALPTDSLYAFQRALDHWRTQWHVPQYVYLSSADNRLLLDLEQAQHVEELRTLVRRLLEGESLLLEEALPQLDQTWVQGPEGHFVSELVVPLMVQANVGEQAQQTVAPLLRVNRSGSLALFQKEPYAIEQRLRPPGSDWLYLKLYCGQALQDELLSGPLLTFAESACTRGIAMEWFFLRYQDPDPHLRLRFRGPPGDLALQLLPAACTWAGDLVKAGACLRFSLETYEREIERYGGAEGIEEAERLFATDSRAVVQLLALRQRRECTLDKLLLTVISADDLLAGLGLDAQARHLWLHRWGTMRHEAGKAYRQWKARLLPLLKQPESLLQEQGGATVLQILHVRHTALAPVGQQLIALNQQGHLTQSLETLYRSYLHMHCNRLLGIDAQLEATVFGLWLRTREGLHREQGNY